MHKALRCVCAGPLAFAFRKSDEALGGSLGIAVHRELDRCVACGGRHRVWERGAARRGYVVLQVKSFAGLFLFYRFVIFHGFLFFYRVHGKIKIFLNKKIHETLNFTVKIPGKKVGGADAKQTGRKGCGSVGHGNCGGRGSGGCGRK